MPDAMLERALARDRWIVGGCVALVAALAWLWLWRQSVEMTGNSMAASSMPDMDMGGAMMVSTADAGPYLMSAFIMWLLMMIAMMLPSAAPMILLYGKLARGARAQGAALAPTAIFAFVYLATWAAFSIAAAIAQLLLIRMGFVSEMTLAFGNWRIGGALLIAAGLYQLTPLKRACLEVLSLANVVPDAPLASELDRRSAHRSRAWTLLPGLLRAIDGVAVRLRSYEPGMGCGAVAFRFDRKSASIWKPNRNPWGLHRCLRRRGHDDLGKNRTRRQPSTYCRRSRYEQVPRAIADECLDYSAAVCNFRACNSPPIRPFKAL